MKRFMNPLAAMCLSVAVMCLLPAVGWAQGAVEPPRIDTGNTAWMLVSTLLVLMMTIPGLALFYGGMVHKESVLATLMQSFVTCCLVSVLWVVYGYSYVFTENSRWLGNASKIMLSGVGVDTLSGDIPETVFIMFQMTFAIIACALIFGSVANRIKFSSALVFVGLWFTFVYIPVAHWVWGPNGALGGVGNAEAKGIFGLGVTLDFAGGTVVHINAGIAGLVAALVLGAHKNFGKPDESPKYNIVFSVIGASLLWVGWFGFNAGSALSAKGLAGMAILVTHIAAAAAALAWMVIEWMTRGKPSVIGIISGAVAGLVAITPASGFVDLAGALIIGVAAGLLCFWGCQLKHKLRFDDSLDVFGVHFVGGVVGALLTGLLAVESIGGKAGSMTQFVAQSEGVVVTVAYTGVVSFVILKAIDVVMGLRVTALAEEEGLDMVIHGEGVHN